MTETATTMATALVTAIPTVFSTPVIIYVERAAKEMSVLNWLYDNVGVILGAGIGSYLAWYLGNLQNRKQMMAQQDLSEKERLKQLSYFYEMSDENRMALKLQLENVKKQIDGGILLRDFGYPSLHENIHEKYLERRNCFDGSLRTTLLDLFNSINKFNRDVQSNRNNLAKMEMPVNRLGNYSAAIDEILPLLEKLNMADPR